MTPPPTKTSKKSATRSVGSRCSAGRKHTAWDSCLKPALRQRLQAAVAALPRHCLQLGVGDVGVVYTRPVCLQRFSRFQRLRRELKRSPGHDLLPFATLAEAT